MLEGSGRLGIRKVKTVVLYLRDWGYGGLGIRMIRDTGTILQDWGYGELGILCGWDTGWLRILGGLEHLYYIYL